ncbi:hypothetical protein GCM10007389_00940 [Pontibacter akesuensis]|nr:hypothetical protein GCM10007389_00940 [Pontibacter akesuensis]
MSLLAGITLLGSTALLSPNARAQTAAPTADENVLSYVEQMPAFDGGEAAKMNFIYSQLQYPEEAKGLGEAGLVVVSFVVETDGSVSNLSTEKSLSKSTDAEALRVAALTAGKWTTGRHRGKPVRVKTLLPIRFSLNENGDQAVLSRMPAFKGGQEAMIRTIYQHLTLPEGAKKEGVAARLQVKFTVEQDGSIANVAIADTKLKQVVANGSKLDYNDASSFKLKDKAVLAQLGEAAAKAIKQTSGMWNPGLRNGKPVAAEVTLPILISGGPNADQLSQIMLLSYQPNAYDSKSTYAADEVDAAPALKNEPLRKFLAQHLRYPDTDFEGTVRVAFIVTQDGKAIGPMTDVQEIQPAVADEIKRVFKLAEGNWAPATKNAKPVTALEEITIAFSSTKANNKAASKKTETADVVVTR